MVPKVFALNISRMAASAFGAWRVRRDDLGAVFYNLTMTGQACLELDGKPSLRGSNERSGERRWPI